ncbi:LysM peptidoglycan-binding domain-containing protein [Vibrio sp. 404]|uniref:LysM peptidoglycan-binding domain-containing protein n=1 Tax=Vibrio marinisediminis TaxID=2758441 RepID=A0A7W2FR25_9VIBR|nr:LysM-like peptidoglycan-binding domain-containing protein [Vibrio marinisediminis]MBA5762680.1 LysM peptidoglycan-binding domain-containing protein [Vibrio marinisediminis]
MNRRKKKPQQVDYIQLAKEKVSAIDWSHIKHEAKSRWLQLPKLHQRALYILVPVVLLLVLIPFPDTTKEADSVEPIESQRVSVAVNTESLSEQGEPKTQPLQSEQWKEYQVKSGDTLARVFRANNLAMADLKALVNVEGKDKPLSQIKVGQQVRFKVKEDGNLDILQLKDASKSVMFYRNSSGSFTKSK